MSEQALAIAIRAEEAAKAAHHRLDRMNGSIDRNTNAIANVSAKADEILRRLDREDGFEDGQNQVRAGVMSSRRFVIGIAATLVGSSALTLLATLLLRGH